MTESDNNMNDDPALLDGTKAHDGGYRHNDCPYSVDTLEDGKWKSDWHLAEMRDRKREVAVYGSKI